MSKKEIGDFMFSWLKKNQRLAEVILVSIIIIVVIISMYCNFDHKLKTIFIGIVLFSINWLYYFFKDKVVKCANFIIDYRYLLALIIFIICLVFRISGSSINIYNYVLNDKDDPDSGIIYGKAREVRSDEYLVHTPYYYSQYYNDYNKISNKMSISGQDMIVGYDAPVLDVSLLAKPLTWGYLLLGNDYGLSWYWCLKIILFSLGAFELTMIITKKNKLISFLGSLLIAFAPTMQWWFVPHFVDVVLWSMWLLVLAYYFFIAQKRWIRNLLTVLTPLSGCVFILSLFPSLQIPLGLLAILLLVVFLIRDKDKITFKKMNLFNILIMLVIAGVILGYTLFTSFDAIKALYSTSYPGKRVSFGNTGTLESIFTNLTTIFLPYKDINYLNNCEVSDFIHFAPIFLLIYPLIYKYLKKKKDNDLIVGNALLIAIIVSLVFYLIGFSEILSKITLFSYVNRIQTVYGFIAVLFSLWCIYILFKYKDILTNKQKIISLIIFISAYILIISEQILSYMPIYLYIIEILFFAFIIFTVYYNLKYLTLALIFLVILFSSFTINPIVSGDDAITNHEIIDEAKEIYENDEGYFLTIDSLHLQSLLLANGIDVLNAVNFYPDFAKWEEIDKDKENYEYYNRYLHMNFKLTNQKTNFELITDDNLKININPKDLEKINVKYLLVPYDVSDILEESDVDFEILYNENYYIYKLG